MLRLGMMRRNNIVVVTPLKDRGAAFELLGIDVNLFLPYQYDLTYFSS